MNLHPGVQALFQYIQGDELTVAELMVAGDLPSPQFYKNVALFNIRITGVGVSYRPTLDEWVYRKPEDYLTDRFLRRCNGLQVIWQHPETTLLNSDEYDERSIGSVFVPYIKDEEVWAIVKIYNDDAITLLKQTQLSTSPAVLLHNGSQKFKLQDGSTLLVEERASLLDHIAICSKGVWDKGGDPIGVEANLTQELAMADEDKSEKEKADKAKADAANFDMMLSKIDACMAKMDAWDAKEKEKADAAKADAEKEEKEKADAAKADAEKEEKEKADKAKADGMDGEAERLAADKKKADAEKEEKEKMDALKADAARADSATARFDDLNKKYEELLKMVQTPIADADRAGLAEVQSRADAIQIQLGERAKAPHVGESVKAYRIRMAESIKSLSKSWSAVKLDSLPDATFDVVESQIYADAAIAARTPSNIAEGSIREVKTIGAGGHKISDFVGNGAHFVSSFSPSASRRMIKNIRLPAH